MSNAIKFTPEGGNVVLSAKRFGRNIRVQVKDTGIGIDADFIERIGQPFAQADTGHDRHYEGSGIGLSVVKGLVALHSGEFQIKSQPGKGTLVTVTLPLVAAGSKPVPSDDSNQLVHLGTGTQFPQPASDAAAKESKGDSRARVSA